MDLSGLEQDIIQLVGIALGAVAIWAVQRFAAKLGVDKNAQVMATLNDAVNQSIAGGVMNATNLIKQNGWDHIDTKNAILNSAVQMLSDHAQTALTQAGYDPTTDQGKQAITQLVLRNLPNAVAQAAASPITPPVPAPAIPAAAVAH